WSSVVGVQCQVAFLFVLAPEIRSALLCPLDSRGVGLWGSGALGSGLRAPGSGARVLPGPAQVHPCSLFSAIPGLERPGSTLAPEPFGRTARFQRLFRHSCRSVTPTPFRRYHVFGAAIN